MNVLVVGANGKIGKQIVKLLQEEGTQVWAMVRKEEQAKSFEEKGIQTKLADLEDSVESLKAVLDEMDAVVFTAGSGGSTGADKTLLIDLDGAVKVMEAAEQAGVKRYVMISAFQANDRENWSEAIKPYYVAKHYADKLLTLSNLDYTIIRPGGLLDELGTGRIRWGEAIEPGSIPREDVAKTVVAVLPEKPTYRKSFDLTSGNTPIEDAVKKMTEE